MRSRSCRSTLLVSFDENHVTSYAKKGDEKTQMTGGQKFPLRREPRVVLEESLSGFGDLLGQTRRWRFPRFTAMNQKITPAIISSPSWSSAVQSVQGPPLGLSLALSFFSPYAHICSRPPPPPDTRFFPLDFLSAAAVAATAT